jgi:WD40 repeat protein
MLTDRPAPSGGPLDEVSPAAPAPARGVHLDRGGWLGAGGMGEVHLARDRALLRDVAVKRARQPGDDARLLREAQITAGLEHPGIVPVYEAGTDADGRPYYAMRLMQGRSLHEAIAAAPEPAARLRLVRTLLDVANAVAFAHSRGVLHLDLKPANVMVGPLGEAVVTDWGLAASAGPRSHGGTPAYMSPEQARGDALDARADVYALGVMLSEILSGAPAAAPRGPPELVAIVSRATSPAPADRYPDVASLAADLGAWFEGRQVSAHAYSRRELVARFVAAWRAPLAVSAVAALALTLTLALGWWRTATERDRAVRAELKAVASGEEATTHLRAALQAQMRTAAAQGLQAEAAVLAANALSLGPSPEARGVLARVLDRPSVTLLRRTPLPGCLHRAVSTDGRYVACAGEDGLRRLDMATGELVHAPDRVGWIAFAGLDGTIIAAQPDDHLLRWSPPAAPTPLPITIVQVHDLTSTALPGVVGAVSSGGAGLVDIRAPGAPALRGCLGVARPRSVAADPAGQLYLACTDGAVLRDPAPNGERLLVQLTADAAPHTLALGPDGELAAGTPAGEVILHRPDGEQRWQIGAPVRELAVSARYIAALTEGGVLHLLSRAGDAPTTLHTGDARLVWAGDQLRVAGAEVTDWAMPVAPEPDGWRFSAGLAALAVGPGWLAAGLGTGEIAVVAVPDGAPLRTLAWGASAIKDLAVSPDGRLLAAAAVGAPAEPLFRLDDWGVASWQPEGSHRRLAWRPDGSLVGPRYDPSVTIAHADQAWAAAELVHGSFFDLETHGDGVAALAIDHGVWRLDGGPRQLTSLPDTHAISPLGDDTIIAAMGALLRLDPSGAVIARHPFDGTPVELTLSAHGRWAAIGLREGDALVLDLHTGELLARLVVHTGRVGSLVFAEDDRWLYTGAWDATARRWSTRAFDAAPDALRAEVDARWGMGLGEVLGR